MPPKWRQFTQEQLAKMVKDSTSFRDFTIKLGYVGDSGNGLAAARAVIKEYQFDISHFTGQGWEKNNFDYSRFRKGNHIKSVEATKAIAYKRGWKCENCGNTERLGQKIPLQTHHIDGDSEINELENLQLLCPNCHALTENYCKKKKVNERPIVSDEDFIEALQTAPNIRQALLKLGLSPRGDNYNRAYQLLVNLAKEQK